MQHGCHASANFAIKFFYIVMFERYTERARRSIFYARELVSVYGSMLIDTEHVLLGILRKIPMSSRVSFRQKRTKTFVPK